MARVPFVVCCFLIFIFDSRIRCDDQENDSKSQPVISIKNISSRNARLMAFESDGKRSQDITNEIDEKDEELPTVEDPTVPLHGIYTDCLFQMSFPCVQRKVLVFLSRLGKMKGFSLIGDFLTVVRTRRDLSPEIKESELKARLNGEDSSTALSALIDYMTDRFVRNHVVRITLPTGVTAAMADKARSNNFGNTIDINLERALETGRGKGDKKMKKMMGMMMNALMGKMALLGPMMIILIKLKALKALILSKIALALALMQLMKKKGGGGGGHKEVIIVHDSHGGGGGGGGGHDGWASSASGWPAPDAGWIAAPQTAQDSYSAGPHTGGGDATYAGTSNTGGWAGGGGAAAAPSGGWAKRSTSVQEPKWVAYHAYLPSPEDRK